jgi:CBS domain-containing protein
MLEGRVADMKIEPYTALPPQTSVEQTLRQMGELNIACVMIVEGDRLLGIFSERDVLHKIADRYEQIKARPVSEFMTPSPVAVRRTDSPAKALNLMAVSGFRHLPIINVDDKVVGILGPRRVTTFLRKYFTD